MKRAAALVFVLLAAMVFVGSLSKITVICDFGGPLTPQASGILLGHDVGPTAGEEPIGIYEQRHIVSAPSLWHVQDAKSVSAVERYWGEPPTLGPVRHGNRTCDSARPSGTVTLDDVDPYAVTVTTRWSYGYQISDRVLAEGFMGVYEENLTAEFGPPVVLGAGIDDYVLAYILVWGWPALMLVVIPVGLVLFGRRLARSLGPDTATMLAIGLTAATVVMFLLLDRLRVISYWRDANHWLALMVGFAAMNLGIWLNRTDEREDRKEEATL